MYPRISDFINDLTGWDLCLPIQSFGFFVAIAFLTAYYLLVQELRRKTEAGIFPTQEAEITIGGAMPLSEWLLSTLLWTVVGYKLGLLGHDYQVFCQQPQAALLSWQGSGWGALLFGSIGAAWKGYRYWQRKDTQPQTQRIQRGIEAEMGMVFVIAFVAGLLGAKLFHNLENWNTFVQDPLGALLSFDGLTFYGGLICAATGIAWYIGRKKQYPVLPFADAAAPALMLAYGIGRIGCQVAGDGDWGIPNPAPKPDWLSWLPDAFWAYTYPHNVINHGQLIPGCSGDYCRELAVPVYPTPLYETLMAVAFFFLLWSLRKRLLYWGEMSGLYLFCNGFERFWIEKIRVNNALIYDITQAEIIASLLMMAGIALFVLARYRWKKRRHHG